MYLKLAGFFSLAFNLSAKSRYHDVQRAFNEAAEPEDEFPEAIFTAHDEPYGTIMDETDNAGLSQMGMPDAVIIPIAYPLTVPNFNSIPRWKQQED